MKRTLNIAGMLLLIGLLSWALWTHGRPFHKDALAAAENPGLPFSSALKARGMIYTSGHIGSLPESGELAEGIRGQTRQTLENIKRVLEENGAGMNDVVKTTVFLADIGDYAAMNEEYAKHFPATKPARSTVAVSGLVRGALIEIEATAVDPGATDTR